MKVLPICPLVIEADTVDAIRLDLSFWVAVHDKDLLVDLLASLEDAFTCIVEARFERIEKFDHEVSVLLILPVVKAWYFKAILIFPQILLLKAEVHFELP